LRAGDPPWVGKGSVTEEILERLWYNQRGPVGPYYDPGAELRDHYNHLIGRTKGFFHNAADREREATAQ